MDDLEQVSICLKEFPNSFQLTLNYLHNSNKVKKVCQTVETEKCEDPADFNEIRDDNLLSYLQWELAQGGTAEKLNRTVLDKDPDNIIALGNYGMMCTKKDNLIEAKQILEKLNALKCSMEYDNLLTNAKAELAYSYARFGLGSGMDGLRYDDHAIKLYEEVLKIQPKNWVWTFGYGLTLQRSLNINFYHTVAEFDASMVFKQAFDALFVVASECENDSLKGKAWCKLASAINQYQIIPDHYKRRGGTHIASSCGLTVEQCIINAEKAAGNDCTVLQECGKQYRYKHNLGKARSCLEAASRIKETTFTHIQLGLLEVDEWKKSQRHGHGSRTWRPTHKDQQLTHQPQKSAFYSNSMTAVRSYSIDELPTNMASSSLQTSFPRTKSCAVALKQSHSSPKHQVSTGRQSSSDDNRSLFSTYIKSPNKLATDPQNPKLLKALDHFKKAIKLSYNECDVAFKEMGIVYRRLTDIHEAIKCFEQYANCKSALAKVVSFEQRGICYLELAAKANNEDEKQNYIQTASHMFLKAIEAQATTIKFDMDIATQSLPTLRQLLQTERGKYTQNTHPLKTLSSLKRLIGDYTGALKFLDDALLLDPEDTESQLQKVETLISSEEYEKAVIYLRLLLCTNMRSNVKSDTLLNAYLGAAEKSLLDNHTNAAREYFQMAYNVAFQLDADDDSFEYQVNIIACSSLAFEIQIAFFTDVIENYFGLHSFQCHEVSANKLALSSKARAITCSRSFLVFANENHDRPFLDDVDQAVSCTLERPSDSYTFILIGNSNCTVPISIQHTTYKLLPEYSAWPQKENINSFTKHVMTLFKALINHI